MIKEGYFYPVAIDGGFKLIEDVKPADDGTHRVILSSVSFSYEEADNLTRLFQKERVLKAQERIEAHKDSRYQGNFNDFHRAAQENISYQISRTNIDPLEGGL